MMIDWRHSPVECQERAHSHAFHTQERPDRSWGRLMEYDRLRSRVASADIFQNS